MNNQLQKGLHSLLKEESGLLVVDVQEKLFRLVERPCEVLHSLEKVIKGFQILKIPIFVTEQYPQGLGETIPSLKNILGDKFTPFVKTSFSCLGNSSFKLEAEKSQLKHWVLVGIEAHVCILQTAKDLLRAGKEVVILNDAISSRSIYDFSTAIAELRDCGARISSVETILFELLRDSKNPEFKQISQLIQQGKTDSKCCSL
jgi:nicotinamidase-related amidase